MKNIIPVLALASSFMMACQSNQTKNTIPDSTGKATETATSTKQCFQHINQKDTALLTLNTNNNQITGTLSYHLFEKDKNNGTLTGIVKGDTIIADYTFQAEGTTSTRQVIWLKKKDQLLEGFGPVEEVNGKMKFKNPSGLTFDQSMVFDQINCK